VHSVQSKIPILLSLVVPLLISGPFLPDLIISVTSIFFLYHVFKNKDFKYFKNNPLIIFFIFCFYCIICSLFADNIMFSLKSSIFYFRIGIFACVIWYMIDKDKSILDFFYYSLLISFSALSFDAGSQYLYTKIILGLPISGENGRVSSFFGDELIMGSYLSRLFPLLFALFIVKVKKNKFEIYYIGALFVLVDIIIFISGERTAFFFLNLSTLFIIILIKDYQKFRLITFILGLITCLIITFNTIEIKERMLIGPLKDMGFVNTTSVPDKKYIFTESHDSLIRTAFKMFQEKPFFGHGPKMFRIKCSDVKYKTGTDPCSTHPHNFYIQLLSETGIIGFSFFFSIFCYILFCAYMQLKSILFKNERYLTDYQVCLLAGILITVWPFSPNGNFFNNWLAIMYSLPIGFYIQSIYAKKFKNIKIVQI